MVWNMLPKHMKLGVKEMESKMKEKFEIRYALTKENTILGIDFGLIKKE